MHFTGRMQHALHPSVRYPLIYKRLLGLCVCVLVCTYSVCRVSKWLVGVEGLTGERERKEEEELSERPQVSAQTKSISKEKRLEGKLRAKIQQALNSQEIVRLPLYVPRDLHEVLAVDVFRPQARLASLHFLLVNAVTCACTHTHKHILKQLVSL